VIGRPNAGKTAFTISFAAYLGFQSLRFVRYAAGETVKLEMTTDVATRDLVSPSPHKTTSVQTLQLECAVGKGKRQFELLDTCGLVEGIHPQRDIRLAMAESLLLLKDADLVMHVIDAAAVGSDQGSMGSLEEELAGWGCTRGNYVILANKMDLAASQSGCEAIRRSFSQLPVLAISARTGQGFREVKQYVLRVL
jgi:50S ribosomal subunit-associated GTPase HflX